MKKKLLTISAILICLSISVAGTLAAFTAEGRATNVITTGGIDVELLETIDEKDTPWTDMTGVMPGQSVPKIVNVRNMGTGDAWVRVQVSSAIKNAENAELPTDKLHIDFNIEDGDKWVKSGDYYYYTKLLPAGETTEQPLFSEVTFKPEMGNEYQSSVATIDVSVEAVQVKNNGETYDKALGWPEA